MYSVRVNQRDRFLETMLFGRPDRIPLEPQSGRESTRKAWYSQGLPETVPSHGIARYAFEQIGSPYPWPEPGEGFPVSERMIPQFEEKVIEVRENSQIVQDWKGNICEIGRQYTTEYLRNAIDFVTRKWIKCPVENREDWEAMKSRYDPEDPARLPADAEQRERRPVSYTHLTLPTN